MSWWWCVLAAKRWAGEPLLIFELDFTTHVINNMTVVVIGCLEHSLALAMRPNMRLSSGELDLMDLLWREGPLTLAQAHAHFGVDSVGYTTMQTRLNRLAEKGLATKEGRPAEYAAAIEREKVQAGHLDQLISKLAGGSVVPLVAQLMQDRKISSDELDELKRLIDQAEPSHTATKTKTNSKGRKRGGQTK